jgi:hypothetical protein
MAFEPNARQHVESFHHPRLAETDEGAELDENATVPSLPLCSLVHGYASSNLFQRDERNLVKTAKLGIISEGTLRVQDLLPSYLDVFRSLGGRLSRADANKLRRIIDRFDTDDETSEDVETAGEFLDELTERLECAAPEFCYFGTTAGDGACFGFFLMADWAQLAKDDGIPIVGCTSEVPKDANACITVSDHGNATYYVRKSSRSKWREVWSVV